MKLPSLIFLIFSVSFFSNCGNNNAAITETQNLPNEKVQAKEPVIEDTVRTWFRVTITKNDSAYMDYEGSWPVFFLSGNSATLQLSKSKNIMGITDILTIYMNGMPSGKVPVVLSNREKGTASMIMSPVTDGAYGLPISATEGYMNIKKNVDSIVSGDFLGKGLDLDKNVFLFKGYFQNAKINPQKI